MKSISNLQLFPRAARTLLLMVAITLTALTAGGTELSGSWSDEVNRNTSWGSDYGTATAFTVNSEADLAQLAYLVNNGSDFSGKTITLAKDLNLSAHEWVSIGYFDATNQIYYSFKGIFDGGNYSISGMTINNSSANVLGLFGTIDNGAIIRNVILTSGSVTGRDSVGGIVGEIQNSDPACQIINCHVLPGVTISGNCDVGGIAGYQYGTISGCSSGASANAGDVCGGLIGSLNKPLNKPESTSLENCFYYGPDKTYAIVGRNLSTNTNVSHCFYAANAEQGVDELYDSKDKAARVYSVTAGEGVTISRSGTAAATYYDGKLKFYGDDGCSFDGTEYATEGTTLTVSTTATFQGYETAINVEGTGASLNEGTLTVGTADVTVSAVKGTPINYTITYNLDGGTASNPLTYTIETETFTLKAPVKAGYTFAGWTGTGLTEATKTVTIEKGSTGIRTYTATWAAPSGSWSDHAATSFATINTSANTLSIASEAEMALFAQDDTYANYTVTLTADINLKDYFWTPIAGFNGTFDGQGHTISGVMVNSTAEQQGLFGTIGTAATVKNLVIANSSITGGNNTGAVVGMADADSEKASTIENCHVLGDVIIAGTNFGNHGGIAGYGGGDINYCTSAAIMTGTDVSYSGGIVGWSEGSVSKCLYYGTNLHNDMDPIRGNGSGENDNYQTYSSSVGSGKFVHAYDADPGIMGTVTKEYSDTGYKVYEKGVSYGGKFYTAVVAMTEDGITNLTAYAGKTIDVAFKRSFTADKPSTVCLPFAYTKKTGDGSFYEFTGIEKVGSEYIATMTEPGTSTLTANTPYLYKAATTGDADFSGTYAIPASIEAGTTTSGVWTFKGTYSTIEWTSAPAEHIYGFSAQDANDGITQGQFVKVGSYVRIKPMRAYLQYNGSDSQFANARSLTRAAATTSDDTLPETIGVRLISANGEVTAIGTLHTRTGEVSFDSEAWYTLDGKRLNAKPNTKGIYVNNGKKVVIK